MSWFWDTCGTLWRYFCAMIGRCIASDECGRDPVGSCHAWTAWGWRCSTGGDRQGDALPQPTPAVCVLRYEPATLRTLYSVAMFLFLDHFTDTGEEGKPCGKSVCPYALSCSSSPSVGGGSLYARRGARPRRHWRTPHPPPCRRPRQTTCCSRSSCGMN